MYNNWAQFNGQAAHTYYSDGQHYGDMRGQPDSSTSPPPSNTHYIFVPPHHHESSPPQLSEHQSYPTHDLRLAAQQTNQTLTALASARRLVSSEYILEPPRLLPSPRNYSQEGHYNGTQQSQRIPPQFMNGSPSESVYYMQPAQSGPTSQYRVSEGHACPYCGKAFGRPSALKIHLAIHTGERAYICPEAGCHRSFSVRSNMSRHLRNVHQMWPDGNQDIDSGDEGEAKKVSVRLS